MIKIPRMIEQSANFIASMIDWTAKNEEEEIKNDEDSQHESI